MTSTTGAAEPAPRSRPSGLALPMSCSKGDTRAGRTRQGAVMGRMVVLVVASALCLGACGGDEDDAADTSVASTTARRGEPIVMRGKLIIAATERSEPIATGTILPGSTLGGSPFCAGGTILDSHASLDPKMEPY